MSSLDVFLAQRYGNLLAVGLLCEWMTEHMGKTFGNESL